MLKAQSPENIEQYILLIYVFAAAVIIWIKSTRLRKIVNETKTQTHKSIDELIENSSSDANARIELYQRVIKGSRLWFGKLDSVVGGGAFAAALGCAGTPYPTIFGLISVLFLCISLLQLTPEFPEEIQRLRCLASQSSSKKDILNLLINVFFRRGIVGAPLYWMGLSTLALVIVYRPIAEWLISWK